MRSTMLILLLLVLLPGCQAKPATHAAANAPTVIASLTDQATVWSCPECGMDYTGAGKCNMCDVDLVKMNVSYICPADDKPVERSGRCPRCDANARVVKTAAVADASPGGAAVAPGANSRTPAPPTASTPSGS